VEIGVQESGFPAIIRNLLGFDQRTIAESNLSW
jgi:hypothetical protein